MTKKKMEQWIKNLTKGLKKKRPKVIFHKIHPPSDQGGKPKP